MNLLGLITRALLLLALLGTASVPSGFMRAQGPEGLRLVLCTADGPQEITLAPDGTTQDTPAPDSDDTRGPACLLSGVVPLLASVATMDAPLSHPLPLTPWRHAHQTWSRAPPHYRAPARAPPLPA